MKNLAYGLFAATIAVILVLTFLLIRQASQTTQAAQAILETEYKQRIINASAEDFLRYVDITPYQAEIGKSLFFTSTRVATETFPANFLDEINCSGESGAPYYKAYPSSGNVTTTEGEIVITNPWEFKFTPTEPMDCEMESTVCFSINGVSKCTFFETKFKVPTKN